MINVLMRVLSIGIMDNFTERQTSNSNVATAKTWYRGHCCNMPIKGMEL